MADVVAPDLPRVSVIICAYTEDRWNDLAAAVESLQRLLRPPQEIIVVVDHNPVLLRRVQTSFPSISAVDNTEPRGLSGARNCGIRNAQCEIIAFIDDDAIATPNWLERLVVHYTDPQVLGVGGAIEPIWVSHKPSWFPEEFGWVVGCTYRGMPESMAQVRNLIGCNMSFRKTVFDHVAGFQSGIGRIGTRPLGCEETELCIRLQQRWSNGVLLYEPDAQVRHRVHRTRANWRYFRERCYAEGLSKATVARHVGSKAGLASERSYTLRTLPRGVWRGVLDAFTGRQPAGLLRAGAIVVGLSLTIAGYLAGTLTERFSTVHRTSREAAPA